MTKTQLNTYTYTIGFHRTDDNDFQILATINNNDEVLSRHEFNDISQTLVTMLQAATDEEIIALVRQDTPDYVTLED
jgi:hypothetical protein